MALDWLDDFRLVIIDQAKQLPEYPHKLKSVFFYCRESQVYYCNLLEKQA